jgi:hypothetical protein
VAGTDTYLNQRECQAGTDEKMDNFRFGFSGIAGFNKWHYYEGNEYGVWENIIRAEQHMNGQDVKNVISSNYIQGRQAIRLDFTDELSLNEGRVLEMQYYLSEDKNSAVGYVYNRTVNYRTAGVGSNCRSGPFDNEQLSYGNFDQVVNFDWNSDDYAYRTEIIDLPNHEDYLFDFYSYPNGEYLSSVTENTGFNDEIRVKFPHLTQDRAVVWFTCQKLGGRAEESTANIKEEEKSQSLMAYPNPTTGKLFIPTNQGAFEVYNSLGMRILVPYSGLNSNERQLDFRGFAKGVYQIHFIENGQTVKICVL